MIFLGSPYPIIKHPLGFFHTGTGIDQVKADLLVLLLTNPGERVMLPDFGTPLRKLVFEPNDSTIVDQARQMIIDSIAKWEPRITVEQIDVSNTIDTSSLNRLDTQDEIEHILSIRIRFFDPENIKEVQELRLRVPLASGTVTQGGGL